MKMVIAAFVLSAFGLMGCGSEKSEMIPGPNVTDADGNEYPTVKIGNQLWMAKNLNVNVHGSVCYDKDPANCEKFGRLYTWGAAKMACPSGWHLPSREEFDSFLATVGASEKERSKNLRAGSWENGKDKYGFSALPAGEYASREKFNELGDFTRFWSSTADGDTGAYYLIIVPYADVSHDNEYHRRLSVRCLQDSNEGGEASSQPPSGTLKDSRDGQAYKTVKIGNQVWMAKNLNVDVPGSMCYGNDPDNCVKYGRLYTSWEVAKMACPSGWHLPSRGEFESLLTTVGASAKNLRAGSWENGKDKYGFSALPAGYYHGTYKQCDGLDYETIFCSSTEDGDPGAYYLSIADYNAGVHSYGKGIGCSVRCIQDSN
ncbi:MULTISPECIES: FISUMP domain-containing protein [unclassified Fibrobacter]|uniref:FISUMP domain-containing protein n=1 Tax=unclassified Fibrobacter TaxID=2634177 RepID=UPI001304F468|nr:MULTISPECIES: FISUMP domain-containing protein [unclassified Fibrobacter]